MNELINYINNSEIKKSIIDSTNNHPFAAGISLAAMYVGTYAVRKMFDTTIYAIDKFYESEKHFSFYDINIDIIPPKTAEVH